MKDVKRLKVEVKQEYLEETAPPCWKKAPEIPAEIAVFVKGVGTVMVQIAKRVNRGRITIKFFIDEIARYVVIGDPNN